ncbi:MAG: RNA 2',3'-cyclic phosphodiesterase [Candidatus Hecatellales archaeon ex4484_218]|nr:MAG: RNA 2',3'-cyclic phosphodiesterase [Candidatus Hecatellales archaeon ex4484_218]
MKCWEKPKMVEKIRSFIAVDIEDKSLQDKIVILQQDLMGTGANLKFVEPENLHLTLRFLGEIPSSILEQVCRELKTLKFNVFNLNLQGVGAFPNLRRINVVWVGVKEGAENLKQIAQKVELTVRKLGFPPDPKGFSPHLTIARLKTGKNKDKLASFLENFQDYEVGWMIVNTIKVKKSTLTPKGPIYTTIETIPAV